MSIDVFIQLVDVETLGRVASAIDSFTTADDRTAVKRLFDEACARPKGKMQPSVKTYYMNGAERILRGELPSEVLDETTGETLLDRKKILHYETQRSLSRFLLLQLCNVQGMHGGIFELSRGLLADRLRGHSHWIDETFSLSNDVLWSAKRVEPAVGGDAWILGVQEAATFLKEADKSSTANHHRTIRLEQDELVEILKLASDENSQYRLLIRTF